MSFILVTTSGNGVVDDYVTAVNVDSISVIEANRTNLKSNNKSLIVLKSGKSINCVDIVEDLYTQLKDL